MTFEQQLAAIAAKHKARADALVQEVVSYSVRQIDQRSPVGQPRLWKSPAPKGYLGGRFRGNWQLGIGSAPSGTLDRIDPSGSGTVSAAIGAIPKDAAGKVYYYVNNLDYAQALEDGHSTQAPPLGIVGLTVIDARTYALQIAGDIA